MGKILGFISEVICGMFLPCVLFFAGAIFFIGIGRYVFSPGFFLRSIGGGGKGDFRSLFLALGGTLGVGNICGVAAAISVGGAGCVFWIWVCALLSAVTKYVESALAVHYREKIGSSHYGGPQLYIKNGLGAPKIASLFCVFCIITAFAMGNLTQVKVASDFFCIASGFPRILVALVFFFSVLVLTMGKAKKVSSFTERAVPILCIVYTVFCLISIFSFKENVILVTKNIFSEAFTVKAGAGGFIGVLCSPALRLGITRGIMSNEAGCGTSPIAYAANETATPFRSGALGVCEVLVDTLLLCTLTAYALLCPQIPLPENSASAVITAFSVSLGGFATPVLAVSVFFFALASVCAWGFYATQSASFLGCEKLFGGVFPLLYALCSLLGCFASEGIVWTLADLSVSLMAIINVIAITLLFGKIRKITKKEYGIIKKRPY